MEEQTRALRIRLVVPDSALSPGEFVSLFECAEMTTRAIVEQEASALLEQLGFPAESRLQTMQTIHRLGRRVPTPSEVVSVERGSWNVEAILQSAAVLFILKEYVHPTIKAAFDDSRAKQVIVEFLRDRVFGGAKRKAEDAAVAKSRYGNLDVVAVKDVPSAPMEPVIEINLARRHIIVAQASDQQLIEEFVERIRYRK